MRFADRLLADAGNALVTAIGRTLRVEEVGRGHLDAARAGARPVLLVFWHSRLLYICHRLAPVGLVMMVSRSRDGDIIARVAAHHGIDAVRGSTSRGGGGAARALARVMKERGVVGGITPDGPRGPRRVLQPGAILVARLARAVIVPVAIGFARKKVFASWDRFQLPPPFARARLVFGEPVEVPADLAGDAFERWRLDLQRRLNETTAAADRPFA